MVTILVFDFQISLFENLYFLMSIQYVNKNTAWAFQLFT